MDTGFKLAGVKTVLANELDKHAAATFKENHPETIMLNGNIDDYFEEFKNYFGLVDLVFGGPPCQGFSVAGKMDINDPRSRLIFSFSKVISIVRPKAFVMENVKALGRLDKFKLVREKLLAEFNDMGYDCTPVLLNAKDFGVPQSRERIFFIGIRNGEGNFHPSLLDKYKKEAPTLREAIAHLGRAGSDKNKKICKAKITLAEKPIMRKSPYAGMLFNGQGRPLNPDGWSSTLPASMGGNRTPIVDERHLYDYEESWVEQYHASLIKESKVATFCEAPSFIRRLTVDEASVLQTFPIDYKFIGSQSKVYSQIGNAVPVKLAEAVAKASIDTLNKVSAKFARKTNLEFVFDKE